jgi:hypothetical protein
MNLTKGDVVQLNPDLSAMFGGCFMVITEPRSWGAVGYVMVPGGGEQGGAGRAYMRVPTDKMKLIGKCEWLPFDEVDDSTIIGHA